MTCNFFYYIYCTTRIILVGAIKYMVFFEGDCLLFWPVVKLLVDSLDLVGIGFLLCGYCSSLDFVISQNRPDSLL